MVAGAGLMRIANGITIVMTLRNANKRFNCESRRYQGVGASIVSMRERVVSGTPPRGIQSGMRTRKPVWRA
jgi:hypothetical protein